MIIVSDTTPLSELSKVGKLDLLHAVFGSITTTHKIVEEFNKSLPDIYRTKHFDNLFMLNYENKFNVGIVLPKSKAAFEYIYNPSSIAWRNFRKMRKSVGIPDVTKSITTIKKLKK